MLVSQPRLLLADDAPLLTHFLTTLLEDEGYQVTVARSLEQACTLLAKQAFDLVLSDSFRAHQGQVLTAPPILRAADTTPVILFTAHGIKREEAIAAGFCDLIAKPFDIDMLLAQVGELVRHRASAADRA